MAARVGRSASAVEGVCKTYPPDVVEQVRDLRNQGLSYAEIARITGRSKSYIGWLIAAELKEEGSEEQNDKKEGKNILPPITGERVNAIAAR